MGLVVHSNHFALSPMMAHPGQLKRRILPNIYQEPDQERLAAAFRLAKSAQKCVIACRPCALRKIKVYILSENETMLRQLSVQFHAPKLLWVQENLDRLLLRCPPMTDTSERPSREARFRAACARQCERADSTSATCTRG
jgi:hypothetical protein